MTKTATLKRAPHTTNGDDGMLPASTELPSDVHAKIAAEAKKNERSFAAQFRLIAKDWAEKHA